MEITCILIYDFFPVWQFIFRPGKRIKNHRSQKFCIHLNPSHRITYGPFVIESVDFLSFLTYIPILVSMEFPDFFLISSCSLRHRHLLLFSSTKYLYRWDFTSFVKKTKIHHKPETELRSALTLSLAQIFPGKLVCAEFRCSVPNRIVSVARKINNKS